MPRIILHIDFDSFFASCEQEFNPIFRNRPIGVTAANGRTCIIASSREAKKLGIKTGARTYEAKKFCPNLILVKADFNKYLEISKKFLLICKDFSPFVEMFSIDEVFMDVTSTEHLFGGVDPLIDKIKSRLKREIGEYITVSIGVSYNKLLAKLASSLRKPNGIMYINPSCVQSVFEKAELTDICGIGERIKMRLNKLGIERLAHIRAFSFNKLVFEFGKEEAFFLKRVSFGIDDSQVIPFSELSEVKSVGRNYCLPRNEYSQRVVHQNIFELCEEVAIKLRRLNKKARTVGLGLRGSENFHQRITVHSYMNLGKEIFEICKSLFDNAHLNMVRMISVWATNLEDVKNIPLSLFECSKRNEKLISAIDEINDRFGDHTIRNGFLLYSDKLTTVPNGYMADKYERTKISNLI